MPADVASSSPRSGPSSTAKIAGQTAKIYASQPRGYEPDEIRSRRISLRPAREATGGHSHRDGPEPTVHARVVVFHGGGLIGGSRAATTNVADYFASLGYVGVNGGLSSRARFEVARGARDVGASRHWLKSHAAEYGGDPEQIFCRWSLRPGVPCRDISLQTGAAAAGHRAPREPFFCPAPTPSISRHVQGRAGLLRRGRKRWPEDGDSRVNTRATFGALYDRGMGQREVSVAQAAVYRELVEKMERDHDTSKSGHNHSSQLLSVGTPHQRVKRGGGLLERTVRRCDEVSLLDDD